MIRKITGGTGHFPDSPVYSEKVWRKIFNGGIMFHSRDIVTAIEIGTSKINVLVGEAGTDGRVSVIGRGTAPSAGSVVKGEIEDMELAFEQLGMAIEDAANASDGMLNSTKSVVVVVTGCRIEAFQGIGSVVVKNPEHKVTNRERLEAHENARVLQLATGREIINSSESYFTIDERRIRNPLNHTANKLEAYVHVVHADAVRLENFRSIVRDSGFEEAHIDVAFSPLADDFGILSDEEREQGVLLVDFGAGTTEFVVEYNSGVQASGVLQVGFDHVCNDLSLGLDLHIDVCRKMIEDKTLQNAMRERREYMEFPSSTGRVRRIPLSSFETIIDARIRETFEIIRSMATAQGAPAVLDAGGVLTGGGALVARSAPIVREVFDMSCRIGQPFEAGGALTGLDTPRCSTIWGALKIAAFYNELYAGQGGRGMFGNLIDVVDGVLNRTRLGWLNFKGARRG